MPRRGVPKVSDSSRNRMICSHIWSTYAKKSRPVTSRFVTAIPEAVRGAHGAGRLASLLYGPRHSWW